MAYQGKMPRDRLYTNLSPLTKKGDLIGFNGTMAVRLPAGLPTQYLTPDSNSATGLSWVDMPILQEYQLEPASSKIIIEKMAGRGQDSSNMIDVDETQIEISNLQGKLSINQLPDTIPKERLPDLSWDMLPSITADQIPAINLDQLPILSLDKIPNIPTSKLEGKISSTLIDGKIDISQINGKIPTSQLDGTIASSSIQGLIPSSQISGNIPTSQLSGTISSALLTGQIALGIIPNIPLSKITNADDLNAIENLSGFGLAVRTANNTWALRKLAVGAGLSITNADGIAGDPTLVNTIAAGPAYATGTFTPTAVGSLTAGVGNYTKQIGRWTRIGNRVFVQVNITWTSHSGSGNLTITGLPFPSVNIPDVNHFSNGYFFNGLLTSFPQYLIQPNASVINIVTTGSLLNLLALSGSQSHQFSISYEI